LGSGDYTTGQPNRRLVRLPIEKGHLKRGGF